MVNKNLTAVFTFIFILIHGNISRCLSLRINYNWNASINSGTGIASSLESSSLALTNIEASSSGDGGRRSARTDIQEIFSKYPDFLGKKSLSFGLLSARKNSQEKISETDLIGDSMNGRINDLALLTTPQDVTEICLSLPIVNISLLTFGQPQTRRFSEVNIHHVVTEIPILGGLLACRCRDSDSDNNGAEQDFGRLQFALQEGNNNLQATTIETRIIDYKPAIAGCAPLNPIRKIAYLSLQRPIHAYVMKRFHHYCHENISK